MPIGRYEVAAELTGFKRVVQSPVPLDVDQVARVDFSLSLGDIAETVNVVSERPVVNSETSSIGQIIDEKQVRGLPLNGRNFIQLGLLVPGTTEGPPGAGTVPSRQGGVAISANGQRTDQNNWMLDGIDNNALFFGLAVIVPSTEAIEQFRVETSNYSAEFGRAAGAVVNLQIKSGTNRFSGVAYEFLRNDAFDAKNFFDTEKAPLRFSQFGGSLGGPIMKDKAFFFGNFEGRRVKRGQTVGGVVPTAAQRRGDFSGQATIFDPSTYDAATNRRQPFANNQIPASRINPISLKPARIDSAAEQSRSRAQLRPPDHQCGRWQSGTRARGLPVELEPCVHGTRVDVQHRRRELRRAADVGGYAGEPPSRRRGAVDVGDAQQSRERTARRRQPL